MLQNKLHAFVARFIVLLREGVSPQKVWSLYEFSRALQMVYNLGTKVRGQYYIKMNRIYHSTNLHL